MLRILFGTFVLLHGLIHFMGFAKAFHYGSISGITRAISKTAGVLWLVTAMLFVLAILLFFLRNEGWWMIALPAVVISQFLIIDNWQDARFGTIANLVVFVSCLLSFGSWQFERRFQKDIVENLNALPDSAGFFVMEKDLQSLPLPVQKYLRYVGVLNKPKVFDYKVSFRGQMRQKGKNWFPFTSEQYNFTGKPTRLFFMKGKMHGITIPGYHSYFNGEASMQIKLFGLFPVVNEQEGVLNIAETVTLFNDMCLLAPATLIDPSIQWQPIDSLTAAAKYNVNGQSITAQLYFNNEGQLVNFVSDDRYAMAEKKQFRFSTPVYDYKNFHGYNLPASGEAVWQYPEGAFTYGKFYLQDIAYNVRKLKRG